MEKQNDHLMSNPLTDPVNTRCNVEQRDVSVRQFRRCGATEENDIRAPVQAMQRNKASLDGDRFAMNLRLFLLS